VWTDRTGKRIGTIGVPGLYRNPALSPDGTRVAVEVTDPQRHTQDIWIIDVARNSSSQFTFDPANDVYPIWSPDGLRVMFGSDRDGGVFNLYQRVANSSGADERVLRSDDDMPPVTWSPDGTFVLYRAVAGGYNLGILPLNGKGTPRLVLPPATFGQIQGDISPDGQWIAYHSDESGRYEIYIRNFPVPLGKWLISEGGGLYAKWRADGKELYYYGVDGRLMAVPIDTGNTLQAHTPVPLFEQHLLNGPYAALGYRRQYGVTQDGQRFLLNVPQEGDGSPFITVVVNWPSVIKKQLIP
jgi:Tol biopolymer transport system component